MIARSSADMVDLFLFSLGPAETLGWMTTQSELTLPTHTPNIFENKGLRKRIQSNPKNEIEEKRKKSHRPLESRAGRKKRRRKRVCTGWIRGLVLYFVLFCVILGYFGSNVFHFFFFKFLFYFFLISPPN